MFGLNTFPKDASDLTKIRKSVSPMAWICAGLGFLFLFCVGISDFRESHLLAGLAKIVCGVGYVFVAPIAWTIGDQIRKFTQPDMFFTSSAGETFRTRIFWMVGPQFISVFIAFGGMIFLADAIKSSKSDDAPENKSRPVAVQVKSQPVAIKKISQSAAAEVKSPPAIAENKVPPSADVARQPVAASPPDAPSGEVKPASQVENLPVVTEAPAPAPAPAPAQRVPVAVTNTNNFTITGHPSFDCGKASTKSEHLICASEKLSQADVNLKKVYRMAFIVSPDKDTLQRQQNDWLKNERDQCADETCLLDAYKNRIAQIVPR
ncbi:uncharacterized protein DUF1311 [Collimonas sp. PA-H2]|nr:uncharacterized protein DUF1311 [Collimonas sp. PA-H2]